MIKMKEATQEESMAATSVFWDINKCPLPKGCSPHLVRPSIKRLLENHGYRGDLTVTAFGDLSGVPVDFLREVFSSGINLNVVTLRLTDTTETAISMVIFDRKACPGLSDVINMFYNPRQPVPIGSIESIVMGGVGREEEETGGSALWQCLLCGRDPPAKIFEELMAHLSSEQHQEQLNLHRNTVPDTAMLHFTNIIRPPTIGSHAIDIYNVKSLGETLVFWDINSCPVPPDFDAGLVGLCIKRFLKNKGYSRHVTIIAIGVLAEVSSHTLEKVYSSGITLHNVPYGPPDTEKLIFACAGWPPLRNIMVIFKANIFRCHYDSLKYRCNLVEPFPSVSLQSFCVPVEEDQCSETRGSAFLVCSLCDYHSVAFEGFGSFNIHLSDGHHQKKLSELEPMSKQLLRLCAPIDEPFEIDLGGVTSVFWDFKICPVPPGRIKLYLKNKGYSGSISITAIGALKGDTLRGVYSNGIVLHNIYSEFSEAVEYFICDFIAENPPPANIIVISEKNSFASVGALQLQSKGYNVVELESLPESGALNEDECTDGTSDETTDWICSVCCPDAFGQGLNNFIAHLSDDEKRKKEKEKEGKPKKEGKEGRKTEDGFT